MRAWHSGTLADLHHADIRAIAAGLAAASAERRLAPTPESFEAWTTTIHDLREAAGALIALEARAANWHYFLEFEIPRRSRRIDAVLLADDLIFLLEWKVGAEHFDRADMWQVEQYALDLRDFHEGSRGRPLIPVLIATRAPSVEASLHVNRGRLVQAVRTVSSSQLPGTILSTWHEGHDSAAPPIDATHWEESAYRPTPNIVEAAQALYEQHDVRDLSISGAQNLTETVNAVIELIEACRTRGRHGIAFITGSPGFGQDPGRASSGSCPRTPAGR